MKIFKIKKTMKQLDKIRAPEKEKVLGFYQDENSSQSKPASVTHVYKFAYALPVAVALAVVVGMVFMNVFGNYDGGDIVQPSALTDDVTDMSVLTDSSKSNQADSLIDSEEAHPNESGAEPSDVETAEPAPKSTHDSVQTQSSPPQTLPVSANITFDEAMVIAIENVGGGDITGIEIETKKGVSYFEVEVSYDGIEYELSIDAVRGDVIAIDPDFSAAQLPYKQAIEIAIAAVGGGTVDDIELDFEKGTLVYEIEIEFNLMEYDVVVDATTGEIVKLKED